MRFKDRRDAGRRLAAALQEYAGRSDVIVLALPRGGVPVAFEVAQALSVPLDVFLVRKLGVPGHPELAMGAIAAGGVEVLSEDLIRDLGIPRALVQQVAVRERLELDRRDRAYRGDRQAPAVRDRTVILVDDGLATGSTMQAATSGASPAGAGAHRGRRAGRRPRHMRAPSRRGRPRRLPRDPEPFQRGGTVVRGVRPDERRRGHAPAGWPRPPSTPPAKNAARRGRTRWTSFARAPSN